MSCEARDGAANLLVRFLRGDVRSGRDFGCLFAVGVGVLEKKPRRLFWPLAEPAFWRELGAGVLDGADLLGGMVAARVSQMAALQMSE